MVQLRTRSCIPQCDDMRHLSMRNFASDIQKNAIRDQIRISNYPSYLISIPRSDLSGTTERFELTQALPVSLTVTGSNFTRAAESAIGCD